GGVDCVVVYKVDRLSRSLLDFARLIALFEQHGANLVSVTQSFDTSTSMGRLTLNVLLSFAQFERELISERTRDKMGAARRKGKWVGGVPMLGYRVAQGGGRLVVDEREALVVREVFDLFVEHESIPRVVEELTRRGRKTRMRTTKTGRELGGEHFTVSLVRRILTSVVYIGKVCYKGQVYAGEHEGIVPVELFDAAADIMSRDGRGRTSSARARSGALLGGILRCRACDAAMSHVWTRSRNRKYRYYVCRNAQERGRERCPTRSVSAPVIEQAVVDALRALSGDAARLSSLLGVGRDGPPEGNGEAPSRVAEALAIFGTTWELLFPAERARVIGVLLEEAACDPHAGVLALTLRGEGIEEIAAELAGGADDGSGAHEVALPRRFHFEVRWERQRRKNKATTRADAAQRLPRAAFTLALGHQIEQAVRSGRWASYAVAARDLGLSRARVTQFVSLACLAPAVQEKILTGGDDGIGHVAERTLRAVCAELDWTRQEELWRRAMGS
ncbi:recombinase family protein, partial [Planctomycetota bacterium]